MIVGSKRTPEAYAGVADEIRNRVKSIPNRARIVVLLEIDILAPSTHFLIIEIAKLDRDINSLTHMRTLGVRSGQSIHIRSVLHKIVKKSIECCMPTWQYVGSNYTRNGHQARVREAERHHQEQPGQS